MTKVVTTVRFQEPEDTAEETAAEETTLEETIKSKHRWAKNIIKKI